LLWVFLCLKKLTQVNKLLNTLQINNTTPKGEHMKDDVNQEATEEVTEEASQVGLGITDLRVFKEVIDVASARGAFKADEFATIGDAYGRLSAFLAKVDQANAPAEDEATEEGTDANTSEDDSTEEE
jgi:uncharacterized protein (DUF697 family)